MMTETLGVKPVRNKLVYFGRSMLFKCINSTYLNIAPYIPQNVFLFYGQLPPEKPEENNNKKNPLTFKVIKNTKEGSILAKKQTRLSKKREK